MPAEPSFTAVCAGCGKYGTAGGFEAAIAHTANVSVCLHVVSVLHTLSSILLLISSCQSSSQTHLSKSLAKTVSYYVNLPLLTGLSGKTTDWTFAWGGGGARARMAVNFTGNTHFHLSRQFDFLIF